MSDEKGHSSKRKSVHHGPVMRGRGVLWEFRMVQLGQCRDRDGRQFTAFGNGELKKTGRKGLVSLRQEPEM